MYTLINQMFKDHFSSRNFFGNHMVDQPNDFFEGRTEEEDDEEPVQIDRQRRNELLEIMNGNTEQQ